MDRRAVELAFVHVGYRGMGRGGGVIEEVAEATVGVDWEGIGLEVGYDGRGGGGLTLTV